MPRVQTTGLVAGNGVSLSQQWTLNGCAAGNTLVLGVTHSNNSFNGTTFTVTDSQGQTVAQDKVLNRANTFTAAILSIQNIAAGTHTLTVTFSNGTAANSFFKGALTEYTPTGAVDQTGSAQNASSTGPVSATTGSPLAQAAELAVCVAFAESGGSGTFGNPSGWTGITSGSSVIVHADITVNSTSAVTANCGTLASAAPWDVVVATYPIVNTVAGGASVSALASADLSTAIRAVGNASAGLSAVGALTNWATVTLAAPLYTGPGGILDPNFWRDVTPSVGTTLYYDATHITIYANGEISSDSNNCSAVVQFFDGSGWSVGVVILTPQMVSYASVVAAAGAALNTGILMAGAALTAVTASGNLSTGIQLAGNALAIANAAASLTTGVQLNSAALAGVTASASLTGGQASLQANANVLAQALGSLSAQIQLAGQVAVNSTVAGGLSAQIVLGGAASALSQAAGQITTAILLAGNASVISTAAGAALLTTAFAGAANAVSTAMGDLHTGLLVAGQALVQSSAGGSLSTGITLAGGAVVDTAAAFKPPGQEAQFGRAIINILSPTGIPAVLPVFIAGSACIATIEYFNSQGEPFVPSSVNYSVQDVSTGFTLVASTSIQPQLSDAVTITGQQNILVSMSRNFEVHQILFQITDGLGQINYASAEFELVRKPGVN